MLRIGPRGLIAVLLATSPPLHAHHSRAMFDLAREVELTGAVRELQWTNPHCYIQLEVRGATGEPEEWSIEMGAPMHLQGQGWTPRTLRSGDEVKVTFYPLRDGGKGGELKSIERLDGQPLVRAR